MMGSKHKDHKFEKIQKVYEKHKDIIRDEKCIIDDKLGQINGQVRNIEDHIDAITHAKEAHYRKIGKPLFQF